MNIWKLLKSLRQNFLKQRIKREIGFRLLPHLAGTVDHGYPFNSEKKLDVAVRHQELDIKLHLQLIDNFASRMPKAQADAFRYIAYRDLNGRLEMYLQLAKANALVETPVRPADFGLIAKAA